MSEACKTDDNYDTSDHTNCTKLTPSPAPRSCSPSKSLPLRATSAAAHPNGVENENGKPKVMPRSLRGQLGDISPVASVSRLLIVSNKVKSVMILQTAALANIIFMQYRYDSSTLESIQGQVCQLLGRKKVISIAFVFHCTSNGAHISSKDDRVLNQETWGNHVCLSDFFRNLVENHVEKNAGSRLDIFGCSLAVSNDSRLLCADISSSVGIPVGLWRDLVGPDWTDQPTENKNRTSVSELYFRGDKIRAQTGQSLAGFEKIRTVGKGAYGIAVLYRKKDDDSLVILKEINLHDLNAAERQLALNEVRVLSILDHPNIIGYYDSFEEDGIIMIEMEYADGGTLAQYLAAQDSALQEKAILGMSMQMVAALKYIHEHHILHRDLKTANIFLTKEGIVKVGDFGISKLMLTSNQAANTVLGTPYYISPEMCEGKPYKDKSDMWALGCILYEMACLQRTFEGSNLPALVNKIMKGQFAPVKGPYSQEFKNLIMDLLQREPEYRPSAAEVWHNRLPEMMRRYDECVRDRDDMPLHGTKNSLLPGRRRRTRSVLYYFKMTSMALTPVELPSKVKIREVAVGSNHVIAVAIERTVYSWGEGGKGQLGHGNLESRSSPCDVEALKGKSIVRASCGDDFSVFSSDNGLVMTCGDGTYGCLGHDDWSSTSRPRLVEALLSVDVVSVACGTHHVCVASSDGQVFTWGCGKDGRLGHGDEENYCKPTEVVLPDRLRVRSCHCGQDGTMLITDVGSVLACGNNDCNKLGLNERQGFLMAMKNIFTKPEVAGEKAFCVVRSLVRHRVMDVSMGPLHTAVIVEPGYVYTMGRNIEGQLGSRDTKPQHTPYHVCKFDEKTDSKFRAKCGRYYTIACNEENLLFIWGTRFKAQPSDPASNASSPGASQHHPEVGMEGQSHDNSVSSISSVSSQPHNSSREGAEINPGTKLMEHQNDVNHSPSKSMGSKSSSHGSLNNSGGFRPLNSVPERQLSNSGSLVNGMNPADEFVCLTTPSPLIRVDSAGEQSESGITISLSKFYCHGENLFLLVDTTSPPPKNASRRKRNTKKESVSEGGKTALYHMRFSASSRDGGDEYSSETSELETKAPIQRVSSVPNDTTLASIPGWLKHELETDEEVLVERVENRSKENKSSASFCDIKINCKLKPEDSVVQDKAGFTHQAVRQELEARVGIGTARRKAGNIATETEVDSLSSSSSSCDAPNTKDIDEKTSVGQKKSSMRTMPPPPLKVKSLPHQGHKPSTRTRSRRAESKGHKVEPQKEKADVLQAELVRTKEEKLKTEKRLQEMEEQLRHQQTLLNQSALKKASEREYELKEEITHLRSELRQQSSQLSDNHDVVLALKEQLAAVQREQQRLSHAESRPNSRHSTQRESRICSLQ